MIHNGISSCGGFLHSNSSDFAVATTDQPLRFGDVSPQTEIMVAGAGGLQPRTDNRFCVGASATARAGSGIVELRDSMADVSPLFRIGAIGVYIMKASQQYPLAFVHVTDANNMFGNYTTIDNAFTNNNPHAKILVTPRFNIVCHVGYPCPGNYHNHNIGVVYSIEHEKWSIFNQDMAPMRKDEAFNVRIEGNFGLTVTANADNVVADKLYLDFPAANNNPRAAIYITATYFPHGQPVYNDHPVGVGYDETNKKWYIANEDAARMPLGAIFNIKVVSIPDFAGVKTLTAVIAKVYVGNRIIVDQPEFNDPQQIVFATQRINSPSGEIRDPRPVGVWYDGKHWTVYNQDRQQMPHGAAFNVFAAVPPIQ